jgi:hypothetical protein
MMVLGDEEDPSLSTTYAVEVFHSDRHAWVAELEQAVNEELQDIGLHRTVRVEVTESTPSASTPVVGAYLGSPGAACDTTLGNRIATALAAGTLVLPVVEDLSQFAANVHPTLLFANGFERGGSEDSRRLARVLLENLGIEERDRRVFISHKRDDGLGAAEQLHDHLTHAGFRPFIDRFAIRSGEAVQDSIADALEDHAFLLLLETPLAHTSEWVFDEVDYALSHTMGILILRWPGDPVPVPGSPGLPRLQMEEDDLFKDDHDYDVLTTAALDAVVARVEASHAQGLVRRRRMLVRSIEEAARASGCNACLPLPDWRLWVEHPAGSTLVGITPRLPNPTDLQALDDARRNSSGDPVALLVHSARVLRPTLRDHLEWIVGPRDLALAPENAIGGWW